MNAVPSVAVSSALLSVPSVSSRPPEGGKHQRGTETTNGKGFATLCCRLRFLLCGADIIEGCRGVPSVAAFALAPPFATRTPPVASISFLEI